MLAKELSDYAPKFLHFSQAEVLSYNFFSMDVKLNFNGTVCQSSVKHLIRIELKPKEGERVKDVLVKAKNQGKVKIGQIGVIDNKEWLRVLPPRF